jgi:hypothetical protein
MGRLYITQSFSLGPPELRLHFRTLISSILNGGELTHQRAIADSRAPIGHRVINGFSKLRIYYLHYFERNNILFHYIAFLSFHVFPKARKH